MATPAIPDDLLLPDPENQKELDLYRTLQDNSNQVNSALNAIGEDLDEKVKASSSGTAGYLDAIVDDSTVEIAANVLQVKALGVDTAQLAADAVDGTKIEDDAVDSEHYVADSIDAEHMANNSVETLAIKDLNVTAGKLEADLAFATFPTTPTSAPDADYEVANKKYVDDNSGSSGVETFTANGTFTAPAGVTKVYLSMIGGGGNGGGNTSGGASGGGGGGSAGQCVLNYPFTVTPSSEYTVTIGSAAAASEFDSVSMAGGANGTSGTWGDTPGVGGTADSSDPVGVSGAGGFLTVKVGNGADGIAGSYGGGGGGSPFGAGANGGAINVNGNAAAANTGAGGGGSGGWSSGTQKTGGAGGSGLVIVMY